MHTCVRTRESVCARAIVRAPASVRFAFICLPLRLMTELSLTRDFGLLDSTESGSYILIDETDARMAERKTEANAMKEV